MLKKKLWFRLLLIYLLALVLPLLGLTSFVTHLLNRQVYQNTSQLIDNNLSLITSNVDSLLKNTQYAISPIFTNTKMRTDLRNLQPIGERTDLSEHLRAQRIMESLTQYASYNLMVLSLDIYSVNSDTMFSTGLNISSWGIGNNYDTENSNWFQAYRTTPNIDAWLSIYFSYQDEPQLTKFFPIYSDNGNRVTEIASVSVSRSNLQSIIGQNSFSTNGTLLVCDVTGNLVLGIGPLPPQQYFATTTSATTDKLGATTLCIGDAQYYLYRHHSDYSQMDYIYLVPVNEITNINTLARFYTQLIFGFTLLILSLAIYGIFRYIVSPLNQLFQAMDIVRRGDLSVRLPNTRQDELGTVNRNFNSMTADLQKLVEENYRIGIFKKELELKFVISQINEHFLYNTLDAIHWSARKHNNPEISAVVSNLSRFYRNVLSSGHDFITVETVGSIIESYLYVQQFRMQERLTYSIHIDPDILQCRVLKYLFQPLVENAVLHGVSKRIDGGHVNITLQKTDTGALRFTVADNGVGIPRQALTDLLMEIYMNPTDSTRHFALKNINTQLEYTYGNIYFLQIYSLENEGTRVWFEIPAETKERQADDEGSHY